MLRSRRRLRFPALAVAVLTVTTLACGNDPTDTDEEEEPEVDSVQLVIGSTTVTISSTGVVTGGPVTIPSGNTNVTASFLGADGEPDPISLNGSFRLEVVSGDDAVVSFTRTGTFSGTLHGNQPGSVVVEFQLFHIAEMHDDFSQSLTITVG